MLNDVKLLNCQKVVWIWQFILIRQILTDTWVCLKIKSLYQHDVCSLKIAIHFGGKSSVFGQAHLIFLVHDDSISHHIPITPRWCFRTLSFGHISNNIPTISPHTHVSIYIYHIYPYAIPMAPFRSSLELNKCYLHFDIHSATTPRLAGSDQRTSDLGLLIHFETIPQQLDLL